MSTDSLIDRLRCALNQHRWFYYGYLAGRYWKRMCDECKQDQTRVETSKGHVWKR